MGLAITMKTIANKKAQRGQIILAAALFFGGCMLILLLMVRLSLQSQEQLRLQHTADYVADAAGIIAARDLNFKAITNRAILANEVVIGQMLGLASWLAMTNRAIENSAIITSWIPYLGSAMHQISRGVNAADMAVRSGLLAAVKLQEGLLIALSTSQQLMHHASAAVTYSTVNTIMKANDPDYELVLLNHATLTSMVDVWLRLQSRRQGAAHHAEYVKLVQDSRDGFTNERRYSWFKILKTEGYKTGGSEVQQEHGRLYWQSIDNLAAKVNLGLIRIETPVGWGGYFQYKPVVRQRSRRTEFGHSIRTLSTTSKLAVSTQRQVGTGHLIPSWYQINWPSQSPKLTFVLRKPATEEGDTPLIWAAGRTELVYERPNKWWPRADKSIEKPNLFNALWRRKKSPIQAYELELFALQVGL